MIGRDIGVRAGDYDVVGVAERAAWIEGAIRVFVWIEDSLQIVIQRITVEQSRRIDQNQSFVFINDVEIGVQRVNWLLFIDQLLAIFSGKLGGPAGIDHCAICFQSPASRVNGQRRRRGDRSRIFCLDVELLPVFRDGSGADSL